MYDFCGIGNACIDIVANVDDAFLDQWKFPKGICTYITLEPADALEAALPSPAYIGGGCAANTAACITALGGTAAFLGRVASDKIGTLFLDDIKSRGIHYSGIPDTLNTAGSTRVFALITPDTQRTFASYYGVQEDLSAKDLDEETIRNANIMYLDGYALNSTRGAEAFLKAAEIAKSAGRLVAFSPSDVSILEKFPDAVSAIIKTTDIFICNDYEALHISGEDTVEKAGARIGKMCPSGVITTGKDGAVVFGFDASGLQTVPISKTPVTVIDTNGAGDHFAGGFLYGLSRGMTPVQSATLGNRCAAAIIGVRGARPVTDYKGFVE